MTRDELGQWYDQHLEHHEALARRIKATVEALIEPLRVKTVSITASVKSKERFLEKATDGKYRDPLAEICDVSRARVVTYLPFERDRIVELLKTSFHVIDERTTETRLDPDEAGYRGVNLVLRFPESRAVLLEYIPFADSQFEVQVHTALENAWAEIDHPRYELGGVLPHALKRRFGVVSMVLELADAEFDRIAKELRVYAQEVERKTERGEIGTVEINSTSLDRFLQAHLEAWHSKPRMNEPAIAKLLIRELEDFGIDTLDGVKNLLSPDMLPRVAARFTTAAGLLRTAMLIEDIDRYFTKAWQEHWYDCFGNMYQAIVAKWGAERVQALLVARHIKFPGTR